MAQKDGEGREAFVDRQGGNLSDTVPVGEDREDSECKTLTLHPNLKTTHTAGNSEHAKHFKKKFVQFD